MNKLIILTGPTAVGKTELSVKLAEKINGEIISADSIQVYKYMDIGSAKVTKEEMRAIPHYLIDVIDPKEDFNIAVFKEMALKAMDEIYKKGKIPIVVGGTGFYIQSLLYDIDFSESNGENIEFRKKLEDLAREKGNEAVHEILQSVDEKSAELIHANNLKRVIRAIEFFEETGTKISEHNETQYEKKSPYNFVYFVLNCDRNVLYERIEKRIDIMLDKGLIDEVKTLKDMGLTKENNSMQGLGYKEILDYLDGVISLEEAEYILKRDTRHFAKRQLTWFRREKEVTWINKEDFSFDDDMILKYMEDKLKREGII